MKRFAALLLALIMVFSFAAAALAEGEEPAPIVVKVGIVVPEAEEGWAAGAAYYAEKYCEENELNYKLISAANAAGMKAALKQFISWGATAIVMDPQWTELEEPVQEVLNAGIRVVNVGADVACDGIFKVTGDNTAMGYWNGRQIVDYVGNTATIAIIDAPSAGSISDARKQGFYNYLSERGYDISYIFEQPADDMTREAGQETMTDILEDYKRVDAVFTVDDEIAKGAVDAITEAGRTDIKVVTGVGGGQEYLNMMVSDEYIDLNLSTTLNSPILVQDAIGIAVNMSNGIYPEAVTVLPTTLVNQVNAEEYIDPENTVF